MIENPYLNEFQSIIDENDFSVQFRSFIARTDLVNKYSWAIPDSGAIELIKKYGPIVEIGAGSGYWSYLLKQSGANIIAYDKKPYNNRYCKANWGNVRYGSTKKASLHTDRSLFLCWPPYNNQMAYKALSYYSGDTLIYVGESRHGCTADYDFFTKLDNEWELVEEYDIPQWIGLHDTLTIYKRKR